ncbi:MAG: hypothetical protein WA624_13685, partial [Methylocella sp.]
ASDRLSGRFTEEEKSVLEAGAERYRQSRESGLVRAILAVSIMRTPAVLGKGRQQGPTPRRIILLRRTRRKRTT